MAAPSLSLPWVPCLWEIVSLILKASRQENRTPFKKPQGGWRVDHEVPLEQEGAGGGWGLSLDVHISPAGWAAGQHCPLVASRRVAVGYTGAGLESGDLWAQVEGTNWPLVLPRLLDDMQA